jgi:hypothetical protein
MFVIDKVGSTPHPSISAKLLGVHILNAKYVN